MINYNIKGTNVEITSELRQYVEKRLAHADKFVGSDPTAHAGVELEFAVGERGKKYRAEFTLTASGEVYRANERGESMHEAIDIATAEIARELGRDKKKRLHIVRHSAARVKDFLRGFGRKV